MPRACVIVLDAVGAGALPDAAEFGDEGSDTLGNVARAVGGLDLPNLEALGLGNVEPLEGCPPQPGAPAVAGRLVERSKGKDTTTGHWELMGVVTPQALPTYPHGFPHDVIDPFMHRTGRGVLGNRPALGHGDHPGARRGAPADGQVDRLHVGRLGLPDRRARGDDPARGALRGCRVAREILTGKHAVGRVIARPFVGEPGNYERTPNRHDFSLEPRRPNYLSLDPRGRRHRSTASARSATSSPAQDIDESHPTKSNVEGITEDRGAAPDARRRASSSSTSSRRTCSGATGTTRSTSTAACRTSTAGCPTCSTRCGPGDLLILTSDHGCDPTTPSTDHSREHALLLAYVAGQERERAAPRRRVRRRRRDRERLARREGAAARGFPGQPIVEP